MSIAGTLVTFAQMREQSCAAANVLADLGVYRGETVALFTGSCPEWVYFWLGAARIGAVPAAVNAASKGDFLSHTLRLSQAAVALIDDDRQARLAEVADEVDTLRSVLVQGDSLAAALNSASTEPPSGAAAKPSDIALFFTSGTTGPSKAAHHMALPFTAALLSPRRGNSDMTLWTAMPLFHQCGTHGAGAMLVGPVCWPERSTRTRGRDTILRCRAAGGCDSVDAVEPAARSARRRTRPRFISAYPSRPTCIAIEDRYRCRIVTCPADRSVSDCLQGGCR